MPLMMNAMPEKRMTVIVPLNGLMSNAMPATMSASESMVMTHHRMSLMFGTSVQFLNLTIPSMRKKTPMTNDSSCITRLGLIMKIIPRTVMIIE